MLRQNITVSFAAGVTPRRRHGKRFGWHCRPSGIEPACNLIRLLLQNQSRVAYICQPN